MKILRVFLRKMNKNLMKTAYHEIGHLLLVLLFNSDFKMGIVTADKGYANKKVNNSNGGLGFTQIIPNSVDTYDKICVIGVAGMCSQNLYFSDKENKNHKTVIPLFVNSPDTEMDNEGGVQDFEIVKRNLIKISRIKKNDPKEHLKDVMYFCFNYLSNEKIWSIVKELVNVLISKKDLTLGYNEIINFLKKNELIDEIEQIRIELINSRYPI